MAYEESLQISRKFYKMEEIFYKNQKIHFTITGRVISKNNGVALHNC